MSDYTVLDWLAWGIVVLFYGGFVVGMLFVMITEIGWGFVLIVLALVGVFWASARVIEIVKGD